MLAVLVISVFVIWVITVIALWDQAVTKDIALMEARRIPRVVMVHRGIGGHLFLSIDGKWVVGKGTDWASLWQNPVDSTDLDTSKLCDLYIHLEYQRLALCKPPSPRTWTFQGERHATNRQV